MLKAPKVPRSLKIAFMLGLVVFVTLSIFQILLDTLQNSFMLYLPPIGLGFFFVVFYVVQPIIVGSVNAIVQSRLYKPESCPPGFLLSGLVLLLAFLTINLLVRTVLGVTFSAAVAVVEAVALSLPFGYLARFTITK